MGRLRLQNGCIYYWRGAPYLLVGMATIENGIFQNTKTGLHGYIPVREVTEHENSERFDPTAVSEEKKTEAKHILQPVEGFIDRKITASDVKEIKQKYGISRATMYRRRKKAGEGGGFVAFIRRGCRKGRPRLDKDIEEIVDEEIKIRYLKLKQSIKATYKVIASRCTLKGLPPPHYNTVRSRISAIPEAIKILNRRGESAFKSWYQQKFGHYTSSSPLQVVQIDHLECNVIVVDPVYRKPIGRPWLTILIDLFSRVIVGYAFTLKAPNTLTVALAVTTAILPKEQLLERLQIEGYWPVFGFMKRVSLDNALTFNSSAFVDGCDENKIDVLWRERATPEHGGHVERLAKTLKLRMDELPGSTFSDVESKGEYDSTKEAVMTQEELEKWFVQDVVFTYHNSFHEEIQTTPLAKYEEGILGRGTSIPVGWPDLPDDPENLLVSFLPMSHKTVQRNGVTWDRLVYQTKDLKPFLWRNIKGRKQKKYLVKRDPRDITKIYFYPDDGLGKFFSVPLVTPVEGSISLQDWLAFNKERRSRGRAKVDNNKLLEYFVRGQAIVNDAVERTRVARKKSQHVEWQAPSLTAANDVMPVPVDSVTPIAEATLTEQRTDAVIPLKEAVLPSGFPEKRRPKG